MAKGQAEDFAQIVIESFDDLESLEEFIDNLFYMQSISDDEQFASFLGIIAVKIDLIPVNPATKVERPRQDRFVGSFYDSQEVNKLFEVAKGTKMELPIIFGAFYGLRRSEILGLRWESIDFNNDTIIINHTVVSFSIDGKHVIHAADSTKTKSSMRTLPLVPSVKEKLLKAKEQQDYYRKL